MTQADTAPTILCLDGELSIFRAMELKQLIFTQPMPSHIDLSGVSEIDTAGVQLLLLVAKNALATGREVHLINPSPPVSEVMELLNLSTFLDSAPTFTAQGSV